MNSSVEVHSAPAAELSPSPVFESIPARSHKFDGGETIDEERRRKRKEQEEKRKRIEENQRRAAMEKRLKEEGRESREDVLSVRRRETTASTDSWDSTAEKRRSLQDLWETLASPTNTNSGDETLGGEPPVQMIIETEVRSAPTSGEFQLSAKQEAPQEEQPSQMDEEEARSTPSYNGVEDTKHRLSEEEMRWESAGHFQPGKLKSRFHEMAKDAPVAEKPQSRQKPVGASRYDWMKNEDAADQELLVPHKLNVNFEAKQTEATNDSESEDRAVKEQPKPLWEDNIDELVHENNAASRSDSEDERKPLVESDEYHKLTDEELKWEGAGQFQPSKLNKSLFMEFDKPSPAGQERTKITQHTTTKKVVTVTKEEVVVSNKVEPIESRPSLVVESEYEKGDRAVVGRLQEVKTPDSDSDDEIITPEMKLRKIEQERRRVELEEIERAREEERRRREREEEEESKEKEDFPDDEFDLKVKTRSVNKIDRSLLGQFSQEDRKEEGVPRRRKPQETQSTQAETISISKTVEVVESQPDEGVPCADDRQVSVTVIKESDIADDEFERKVLGKKIGKINFSSSPFHGEPEQAPYATQPKQPEPTRIDVVVEAKKPFEEVIPVTTTLEIVESQPTEFGPGDNEGSDEVSLNKDFTDDPFERKVQEKKIGKINLGSSPFLAGNKAEEPRPDIRRKRREEVRREEGTKEEESEGLAVEMVERAREQPTEASPVSIENDFEDDEFELKVKKKEVGKLNMAQFEFQQREAEEKEQRLRQLEEERRRKEREEKEKLQREEEQRRLQLEAEARVRAEEDERIRQEEEELERLRREDQRQPNLEIEVTIEDREPKSVGKLDITKFSQFQNEATPPPKPPRTYEAQVRQPPQEPAIQTIEVSETRSAPDVFSLENRGEEIDYEGKRKDVGRLNTDWYSRQQQQEAQEAQRKTKYLEEERMRLEREEIERSRQEEAFNQNANPDDGAPERESTDKPSSVGKLNLDKFSQFQQSSSPPRNKPQRVEVDGGPKAQPREVVVVSNVAEVESSPEAEFEVDRSDKPRNVGKLDHSHVAMFSNKGDTQTTPRAPTPDRTRSASGPPKRVEVITKEDAPSSPRSAEQEDHDERVKNVKKLDVDRFIQSRREESVERQQRKKQLEEERLRIEKREMEERRKEERRRNQSSVSDRVDGEVIELSRSSREEKPVQINGNTEHDEKPKNVGKLNLGQFAQFQKADASKPNTTQERAPRQETRGNDASPRRYVIERKDEARPYKDINHNITYKNATSGAPVTAGEKSKTGIDDVSIVKSNSSEEKVIPKRLSRDMFAAFQSGDGNNDQPAPMRRAKSEMQLNNKEGAVVGRKAWRDDDAVTESRRRKDSREQRRPRPKSIAFIDTSMFEN